MLTTPSANIGSTLSASQPVPQASTRRALHRLTSEVERDPVHSVGVTPVCFLGLKRCLGGRGAENVDYNFHFHSPTDTNVSIVGSHVWVHVLQLPRAGQATHTPAFFRWTRTLAIVSIKPTTSSHENAGVRRSSSGVVLDRCREKHGSTQNRRKRAAGAGHKTTFPEAGDWLEL